MFAHKTVCLQPENPFWPKIVLRLFKHGYASLAWSKLQQMKLAIVILNWNGKKLLEQFLPSVVGHNSHNADVYIADNASTDASLKYVKENFLR